MCAFHYHHSQYSHYENFFYPSCQLLPTSGDQDPLGSVVQDAKWWGWEMRREGEDVVGGGWKKREGSEENLKEGRQRHSGKSRLAERIKEFKKKRDVIVKHTSGK